VEEEIDDKGKRKNDVLEERQKGGLIVELDHERRQKKGRED
jgi:hypothetical protein